MITRIRQEITRLATQPLTELSRAARLLRFQIDLWRLCSRQLHENNVMAMSAALSFRTIFALVPLLVLVFLGAKSLGVLEDHKQTLRRLLQATGFSEIRTLREDPASAMGPPASAPVTSDPVVVTNESGVPQMVNFGDELERLVATVESKLTFERIGPIGGAILVWTALTLIITVEQSLNRIFRAPKERGMVSRLVLYWSATTLGPLTLAVTAYFGQQLIMLVERAPGVAPLLVAIGWLGPILVGIVVVSLLYAFLPNTTVRYESAVGGAAAAVVLWVIAKWGFTLYVSQLVLKPNLYGVLGVIPLFLLWLNLSWTIFLFGAQLAHTTTLLADRVTVDSGVVVTPTSGDYLAATVAVAASFEEGRGGLTLAQLARRMQLPRETVRRTVERLTGEGVLSESDQRGQRLYLLGKPAMQVSVIDVLRLGERTRGALAPYDPQLAEVLMRVESLQQSALADLSIHQLLQPIPLDEPQPRFEPAIIRA